MDLDWTSENRLKAAREVIRTFEDELCPALQSRIVELETALKAVNDEAYAIWKAHGFESCGQCKMNARVIMKICRENSHDQITPA